MEQEDTAKLDLGSLGSLDFTPDWAKKDAGVSVGNVRDRGEGGERGERKPQSDRRQQGGKPAQAEEALPATTVEKTTLGDISALAALKEQMEKGGE